MNRMAWMLAAVVVGVSVLTGCSESSTAFADDEEAMTKRDKVTVSGTVSSGLGANNALAIALGEDGKKVWTRLDARGDFTLRLGAGKAYRILIANELPNGGQKVIGKVSLTNGAAKTAWFSAKSSARVDLGTLSKADAAANTIAPKCLCEDPAEDTEERDAPKKKGGYGGGRVEESDDGAWGGGGRGDDDWDGDDDDDDARELDNHDDDNECFGDDEDTSSTWDDGTEIDVCTEGGVADLEPSHKDSGNFGDFGKRDGNLLEAKSCGGKVEADRDPNPPKPNPPAPAPKKTEPAGEEPVVK